MNDDELEADLRRLLADPGHRLPDTLVPLEGVHAGARRRKARRQAFAAVAGATAGVLGVVAFVGINHLTQGTGPANAGATGRTPVVPSSAAVTLASPDTSATPTSVVGPGPAVSTAQAVPADFTPVSVTAISSNSWWVLGRGGQIVSTSDGGKSFSYVSGPATSKLPAGATQLRFDTDGFHGWAVSGSGNGSSGGLSRTTDGGVTWSKEPLSGSVGTVELGGGKAYALVVKGSTWAVWETAADGSTAWQEAGSLGSLPTQPLIAVQSGNAIVADTSAGTIRTWVFGPTSHTSSDQPCDASLGATTISATVGGVWLTCATGTADGLWRSDDGTIWAGVSGGSGSASRMVVGAIDKSTAAVGQPDGQIYVVSLAGENRKAKGPFDAQAPWTYIAFTNKTAGFAIDDAGRMLRTDDGGMSWTQITFH